MSEYSDRDEQFHYRCQDCGFRFEDTEEIQDTIDAALGTGCKEIENSKLHSESSQHTEIPRKD